MTMKTIKFLLCIMFLVSAIAYAGNITLGPTKNGMIFIVKNARMTLEEFTVTNAIYPDGADWIVMKGGGNKTKIIIDGNTGKDPYNANIIIDNCKMIKGKKTAGVIDNLIFGTFTSNDYLGVMKEYTPGNGVIVKLKGTAVGTIIAAGNKIVLVDSIVNFTTDYGYKDKGAKVYATQGDIGGSSEKPGWLGLPSDDCPIVLSQSIDSNYFGSCCRIKKLKAKKGAVANLNIYASGIVKNGKPKTKIKSSVAPDNLVFSNEYGWIIPYYYNGY